MVSNVTPDHSILSLTPLCRKLYSFGESLESPKINIEAKSEKEAFMSSSKGEKFTSFGKS